MLWAWQRQVDMKIWMISFCGGLGHVREYICDVYLILMKGAQMLACFASRDSVVTC